MSHLQLRKHAALLVAGMGILAVTSTSCKKDPFAAPDVPGDTTENSLFGVWVQVGNTNADPSEYVLTTTDLMKDTVLSPVGAGIEVTGKVDPSYGVVYNGFFYTPAETTIRKFGFTNSSLNEVDNVIVNDDAYGTYIMKHFCADSTLHFLSWAETDNSATRTMDKKLYMINANTMTKISSNSFKFPVPTYKVANTDSAGAYLKDEDFDISPVSLHIQDNKAYVGFVYWSWTPATYYRSTDTAYMLICDYPSLTNTKVIKTGAYGSLSGTWFQSNSSFADSKGDYYMTTVDRKNNYNYTVIRIKKGATEFDASYAFSLAGKNAYIAGYSNQEYDHHTYIKDGKALIGSLIVDVWNQTVVADLNTLGLGTVQESQAKAFVDNGNLYVFVKDNASKWYIARYNPDNNTFTKGSEIIGGVTSVRRIEKLK